MGETPTVAIVMSRMPRLITPDAVWLSGLRACLRQIRERQLCLLMSQGTSGSDFISRGARRLEIATQFLADANTATDQSAHDRLLVEVADKLLVLGIRKQGNIHRLLINRLKSGRGGVLLVDLPELQTTPVREELVAAGATLWTPPERDCRPLVESCAATDLVMAPSQTEVVSFAPHPLDANGLFLTHTTRACPGPWPRQPTEEYLDCLLDGRREGDHSALMTLLRIVRQRLLIGSCRTIRGGFPVVSFTAVPLDQLPELRCFRTHRSHWDFEPYGLSIRRDALEHRGIRPVIYGDEQTWDAMPDGDRPFFQLNRVSATTGALDWSGEREWRHVGDVDLSGFSRDELTVFVPTFEAAKLLQPLCPWPITLWPGEIAQHGIK